MGLKGKTKSLATMTTKIVVPGIVELFHGFQLHIISGYKDEWRCWILLLNHGEKVLLPECISQHCTVASDPWCNLE